MKLSLVPLLIAGKSVSPEIRKVLRANRLKEAARLIVEQYGLAASKLVNCWMWQRAIGRILWNLETAGLGALVAEN